MNLVAPFGFFGAGNIGDESTLQGFARLVSRYQRDFNIWVASRNPEHTGRMEPSFKYYKSRGSDLWRRWLQFRSSASVIVGGTPIMDVLGDWPLNELVPMISAAKNQKKRVVFVGAGTEALQREKSKRLMSEFFAPRVEYWTVKSERDKERLTNNGIKSEKVTVAADLAWTLDAVPDDFGKQLLMESGVSGNTPLVGVNITNEQLVCEQEPQFFEKVARFLDELIDKHDVQVLFIANEVREGETFDKVASAKALSHIKRKDRVTMIPNHYWSPEQMRSLISCCQMTITMRYHFCLFSAMQGVPFIALKRSGKVDDLCWDLKWPYGALLGNLDVSELLDMFSAADHNRASIVEYLNVQTKLMREKAFQNSVSLDALFER